MKILKIYDNISKQYVDVEVTDEVYTAYMRTKWSIENSDNSFYEHEIQFSALKGNVENSMNNFHEFISYVDDPETTTINADNIKRMYKSMDMLKKKDRELIEMLYFMGMTEREIAKIQGTFHQNINEKKQRILCKLNEFMKIV